MPSAIEVPENSIRNRKAHLFIYKPNARLNGRQIWRWFYRGYGKTSDRFDCPIAGVC